MFCTNCGSKLPEGARFCSTCGVRVAEIFEVPEVSEQPAAVPEAKKPEATPEKSYEAPLKKRVTFDWSNVIDEPQKKVIADIKSPWETSGSVDEKELYSEMPQPSGKSRTMSFIDVLKAEKEELARGAAPAEEPAKEERPIEYTEVLDPGYLNEGASAETKEEKPELHIAPLYEDVDEPVVTPFDLPAEESAAEPEAPAEEPEAAEPEVPAAEPEAAEEIFEEAEEEAAEEAEPEAIDEKEFFEMPDFLKPKADERKTFADFSFHAVEPLVLEKEPAAEAEPVFEEPVYEEPEAAEPEEPAEEPVVLSEPEFADEEPVVFTELWYSQSLSSQMKKL